MSGASKPRGSGSPPPNTGVPTPTVRRLRAGSRDSSNAWRRGLGVPDAWVTPRVSAALAAPPPPRFSRSSTPWLGSCWPSLAGSAPISPALPRVSLQLPRQPASPCALFGDLLFKRGAGHPPLPYATPKAAPTCSGDPLPRGTQTQYGARAPLGDWGVVPPTRGSGEVGREQGTGKESCEGCRVVPVQARLAGVPLAPLPPAPSSPRGSPLVPSSPRRRPSVVVRSAAHPLSGTRPPRDSACLASSPAPFPHFLGLVPNVPHLRRVTWLKGERLGLRERWAPASPRTDRQTDRQTDGSVSDRPALGQSKARAKRAAAAAAGAESASGPVPPPLRRGAPTPWSPRRPPQSQTLWPFCSPACLPLPSAF